MAEVIKYDVTGVEEGGGGTGVKVRPGVKVAQVVKIEKRSENAQGGPANDLKVALSFGPEFDWGFTYVGLGEASDWKLAEFIRALGLPEKGGLNLDKINQSKPLLRVKVNHGTYEGQYSPDFGKFFKAQKGDTLAMNVSELKNAADQAEDPAAGDEPEPTHDNAGYHGHETQYTEGFAASRESDPECGSYDDWADEDLEAEVADRGLTLPGGRASKRNKCITALREEDALVEGGGDGAGDEPEPDAAAGGDDYDEQELDALVTEYEARNFEDPLPTFRGSGAADRKKAAIIEKLREDDAADPFEA